MAICECLSSFTNHYSAFLPHWYLCQLRLCEKKRHNPDDYQTWENGMQMYPNHRIFAVAILTLLIGWTCVAQAWAQGSWSRQNSQTTTDLTSVFFVDANNGWVAGENGRILHTTNGGSLWQAQVVPTLVDLESIVFADADQGWAVGDGGVILHTVNGGSTWSLQTSGLTTDLKSVFFVDATTGWAAGSGGKILKTTSSGNLWAPSTSRVFFIDFKEIFFTDASIGQLLGGQTNILTTLDGGSVWTIGRPLPPEITEGPLNSIFFLDTTTGWSVGDNSIIKTTTAGITWERQEFTPPTTLNSVFATDANNVWTVGTGARIFRTSDGGASWNTEESGIPLGTELTSVFFVDSDNGWAVGREGEIVRFSTGANTILAANFVNGNNDLFNSRVYLFNSSSTDAEVTVHVFALPARDDPALSTTSPLSLGTLRARSALNVKLAEDILAPLLVSLPYTAADGNLTLEFTIRAPDVQGAAQVFSSSRAFGTYALPQIPTSLGVANTVLVANFMNGNDAAFDSEVYLLNSSQSSGNVAVRVFTLPLKGGTAQELTTTPLALGTLDARSALNIKVAEDILTPLQLPRPYTTDGGNLTLEFEIQAAGVRGAAQVFSSDFAYGTYPLQEIPVISNGGSTVLVSNFMNGNDGDFNSRVYLFNPSQTAGNVSVRVFTLPLRGGTVQELTTTPLSLGTLASRSALNIKLAEDILTPLQIPLPYITDGGNLTLEFTIQAAAVVGAGQVFSSDFAFGTYPLQEVPATSAGSPTVLAANYVNGNNSTLNSRVYLFNPSQSAGDITVQVYTLPLRTGTAQQLGTPRNLGSLAARSAVNIKVVEDILTPLGITTPYTTDGGNLTLEFTIQAADVRGAAQVFSSDFAFGTYPLQVK
jgi:photosystem II stability/assembly factor-like uncharacterized protein